MAHVTNTLETFSPIWTKLGTENFPVIPTSSGGFRENCYSERNTLRKVLNKMHNFLHPSSDLDIIPHRTCLQNCTECQFLETRYGKSFTLLWCVNEFLSVFSGVRCGKIWYKLTKLMSKALSIRQFHVSRQGILCDTLKAENALSAYNIAVYMTQSILMLLNLLKPKTHIMYHHL